MAWAGRRVGRIRAMVRATYGDACWLCGGTIGRGQAWDVDHVTPRALGGGDDLANLRPAHARCNRRRGVRPVVSWEL